jgi:hypothetical protein
MKRSLPVEIEHAAFSGPGAVASTKLRHAPAWVHAQLGNRISTPKAKPGAAKTKPALKTRSSAVSATLVMALAPGLSKPVALVGETVEIPEYVSARGWASVASQLKRDSVPILTGHSGGKVLGFTKGPRFRYRLCETGGMLFALDVRPEDPIVPSGAGCSICFFPKSVRLEYVDGRAIRVLDEIELRHLAIIRMERPERPVYPLARVVRCLPHEVNETMLRMRLDLARDLGAAWPALRSLERNG